MQLKKIKLLFKLESWVFFPFSISLNYNKVLQIVRWNPSLADTLSLPDNDQFLISKISRFVLPSTPPPPATFNSHLPGAIIFSFVTVISWSRSRRETSLRDEILLQNFQVTKQRAWCIFKCLPPWHSTSSPAKQIGSSLNTKLQVPWRGVGFLAHDLLCSELINALLFWGVF